MSTQRKISIIFLLSLVLGIYVFGFATVSKNTNSEHRTSEFYKTKHFITVLIKKKLIID